MSKNSGLGRLFERIALQDPHKTAMHQTAATDAPPFLIPNSKFRGSPRLMDQGLDVWTIFNEAAEHCPTPPVNLGQGFMSYNPPEFLIEAAKSVLDSVPCNQYSPPRGRQRLRQVLAAEYSPLMKRQLNPDTEILVTAGANEGIFATLSALLEVGDEVIVFEPFFDQYAWNLAMLGCVAVHVPMRPPPSGSQIKHSAKDWKLDFDELEKKITSKSRIIILNTPHNPVGKMFNLEELQKLGDIAVRHDLIIISDEVYERLDFEVHHRIAALSPEIADRTVTVGSAGKIFGCTGWRVGWVIGHENIISYVLKAHTRIVFTVNSPGQEAVAIGLERAREQDYYKKTVDEYKERMSILCNVWDELGLPFVVPQGGCFVLVNFSKVKIPEDYNFPSIITTDHAKDFQIAYWLLMEFGVVAIPPSEFYSPAHRHLAENYLRFAFCKDTATLHEAAKRLKYLEPYIE